MMPLRLSILSLFVLFALSCSEESSDTVSSKDTGGMMMDTTEAAGQAETLPTRVMPVQMTSMRLKCPALHLSAVARMTTPRPMLLRLMIWWTAVPPPNPSPDSGVSEEMPDGASQMPVGSQGCGAETPPGTGMYDIDADGVNRTYHLELPENYDANRAHKLIFVWHGLGGSIEAQITSNFQGLGNQNDGSAIIVAGQGLAQANQLNPDGRQRTGWANKDGGDIKFVRALLARMRAELCIDNDRIFSTGVSFGGIFTNRIGCELADEFRAIAPIMGQGPEVWRQSDCSTRLREANCVAGQVAAWITHGSADNIVPYCGGERSRDYWQSATAVEPSQCP